MLQYGGLDQDNIVKLKAFSEASDFDEDDIELANERDRFNKANLLKWVTEMDFTTEFNLVEVSQHPF